MIIYLTGVVAGFAILGVALSAIGWRHSLLTWDPREADWWFALAKVLYALAIGLRIFVWDIIWWPLHQNDQGFAVIIVDSIQMLKVNFITVMLVSVGAYCSLKARQLVIPFEDRHNWPWWRAWMHPHWNPFRRRKRG